MLVFSHIREFIEQRRATFSAYREIFESEITIITNNAGRWWEGLRWERRDKDWIQHGEGICQGQNSADLWQVFYGIEFLSVYENIFLGWLELKIPVVDPAIAIHDSIYDKLAPTLFMAGHASIVVDKEFDISLTELWVIARESYGFMTVFTLQ